MRVPQILGRGQSDKVSTISAELSIFGKLTASGAIELEGKVQGDITCTTLVICGNAELNGTAIAQAAVVRGRVLGCIRALSVTLEPTCHVLGEIFHKDLFVVKGAHFEGTSSPSVDPIGGQTHIQIALAKAKAAMDH
jgi:cytoskeletal protein CcmA (bactofilin family)